MLLSRGSNADETEADRRFALVVEGGHVGQTLANHLSDEYDVTFVSTDRNAVKRASQDGVTAHHTDRIDASALGAADADRASLAVAASARDGVSLLAAQLLRTTFGVERVVMQVNDPERLDSLRTLDVEAVCVSDLLVREVSNHLRTATDDLAETT